MPHPHLRERRYAIHARALTYEKCGLPIVGHGFERTARSSAANIAPG
jgi:hypothetical protein